MTKLKYNLDEIQSFGVTPGRHRAKLIKVEQTLSRQKKPMLVWYWKIVAGPEKGKEVRSFTSLVENALSNLKEHLEAMGLHGKVNVDTSRLVGRFAILIVTSQSRPDENGIVRDRTLVSNVLPDGKSKPAEEEDDYEEDEDADEEDDADEEEGEEEDDEEDDSEDEDEGDEDDEDDEDDEEDDEEEEEPAPRRPASRAQQRRAAPAPVKKVKPAAKQPARKGKLPF